MAKIILAINAGSSSVKISVYKAEAAGQNPTQIAEAQVAGLTAPPATFDYKRGSEKIKGQEIKGECSQEEAFEYIVKHLEEDQDLPEVSHRDDIHYACHRVVHGGDYPNHRVIDRSTYHHLQELTDLAPLHNKGALAICRACHELCPKAKNIAQFDSSFHQTIPEATRTYLIDPEVAKKNSLRKYGFHGISYAFITRKVAQYLQKDISELNIIALHLGSGASVCAIKDGKSLDTSMGLTPLDGLPGATRSGAVDPCVAFHLAPSGNKEMHISEMEMILNKKSGWSALTGTTDFGKIVASDSKECKLAHDVFVDRILNFVGSYYLKMEGNVDAIVFAGGLGEKASSVRKAVLDKCRCFGFRLDEERNKSDLEDVVEDIGAKDSQQRILVCQTDEQFEMARSCVMDSGMFSMH